METEQKKAKAGSTEEEDLIYKNNRELFYSYNKEKNCYTLKVDYQYQANQVIIKQGWDVLEERVNEIKNQVIRGEVSPLAYFMEKNQMEIPMLAGYAGLRKWRVKRHLKPKYFNKLSQEELGRYASALDVPVSQLIHPDFLDEKKQP
jgi:hypothetical protein